MNSSNPYSCASIFASFSAVTLWIVYVIIYGFSVDYGISFHGAECSFNLALWLLVFGGVGLLGAFFILAASIAAQFNTGEGRNNGIIVMGTCFGVFQMAWQCIGSAWVYGMGRDSEDCDSALLEWSWVLITVQWALYALIFLLLAYRFTFFVSSTAVYSITST